MNTFHTKSRTLKATALTAALASWSFSGAALGATTETARVKASCTKIARVHFGHPSKGYDVVKRVAIPCNDRR